MAGEKIPANVDERYLQAYLDAEDKKIAKTGYGGKHLWSICPCSKCLDRRHGSGPRQMLKKDSAPPAPIPWAPEVVDASLKRYGLRRHKPVGKRASEGIIYAHINYGELLCPEFAKAKEALVAFWKDIPGREADYNVIRVRNDYVAPGHTQIDFIAVPDFDTADEPTPTRVTRFHQQRKGQPFSYIPGNEGYNSEVVYHHKWMFVLDDYKGFDVQASKTRSCRWYPFVFPDERPKIGSKAIWTEITKRFEKKLANPGITQADYAKALSGELKRYGLIAVTYYARGKSVGSHLPLVELGFAIRPRQEHEIDAEYVVVIYEKRKGQFMKVQEATKRGE